jgi:hypothetical protein
MTNVYSTVLSGEFIAQPPAELAQKWLDTLLKQLELDGFGAGVSVGTVSNPNDDAQLASSGCMYPHTTQTENILNNIIFT